MELLLKKLNEDKERLEKRMDRLSDEKERLQNEITDIEDEYCEVVDYAHELDKAIELLSNYYSTGELLAGTLISISGEDLAEEVFSKLSNFLDTLDTNGIKKD